jgi:drug/metabolite transporter (DMT)-like permease
MKDKHLGILLAITGAALWGTSGTAAEMLYQNPNINTFWLVDVRSWLAGASLLLISLVHKGKGTFAIFKNPRDLLYAALFSMLGITGAQFTYFYTVAASNAPTATVLVFLAPVLIILLYGG